MAPPRTIHTTSRTLRASLLVTASLLCAASPTSSTTVEQAPQLPNARKMFAVAEARGSAPVTGEAVVLLCEVKVVKNVTGWDSGLRFKTRYPDPAVLVRHGGKMWSVFGGNDVASMTFSIPGVSIKQGDALTIHLRDIDVAKHDLIGTFRVKVGATWPLKLKSDNAEGSCYRLNPKRARRELPGAISKAKRALAKLERALRPRAGRKSLGYPGGKFVDARIAVDHTAALVGREDARASALHARLKKARATWDTRAKKVMAREVRKGEKVGAVVRVKREQVRLSALGGGCDAAALGAHAHSVHLMHAASRCVVRLRVTNAGKRPIRVDSFFGEVGKFGRGLKVRGVSDTGRALSARWLAIESDGRAAEEYRKPLPAGATITVTLGFTANTRGAEVALVRVLRGRKQVALFRAR